MTLKITIPVPVDERFFLSMYRRTEENRTFLPRSTIRATQERRYEGELFLLVTYTSRIKGLEDIIFQFLSVQVLTTRLFIIQVLKIGILFLNG